MRQINCAHLLTGKGVEKNQTIEIDGERIGALRSCTEASKPRLLAMPALVNAHDHGRAVRTSSIGASGKPLEAWLQYLALFPSVDPYLAAAVSLGNSALGGAGVVMMHYPRAQGFTDLPTEVAEVARAARDVGVRVGFAVSMKDRKSDRLWAARAAARCPSERRARGNHWPIRPPAAGAEGLHQARGRCRRSRRWSDLQRAIWSEWRAMVQRRAAGGRCRSFKPVRAAGPHASV